MQTVSPRCAVSTEHCYVLCKPFIIQLLSGLLYDFNQCLQLQERDQYLENLYRIIISIGDLLIDCVSKNLYLYLRPSKSLIYLNLNAKM